MPSGLLTFFHSPHIRKVGVKISADLKRLFHDCGFIEGKDQPFEGAVELGKIAKETGAAMQANIGLLDLCASILKHFLSKEVDIRVSLSWDQNPLPDAHIQYAALDAFATWQVFKALQGGNIGNAVDASTIGGTPVALFSSDNSRIVAHGHIVPERPAKYQGVNITKTRLLVVVSEVLVPGHLVPGDLLPGKES